MEKQEKKLGFWLLAFIGLGSMIGSGIFNSPKDLVHVANPAASVLAWAIGGFGALMLALIFIYLSAKKPELKSGIFAYAQDGFGDYMGFNSAWGYWSLGWLGNVSYFIIFFKTLNDLLGEKALSPVVCFLLASGILWFYYFILKAGIREGAALNLAVTVAKLIPIALVMGVGFFVARSDIFSVPDWQYMLASSGEATTPFKQTANAMAIVLWCFIGVESASVLSARAKSLKTVRRATIFSTLCVLVIYVTVTTIAMASIPAKELAASGTPLALVLEKTVIGKTGALVVKIGIMVSVIGASISWILLSVETMFAAAKNGVMPRFLTKENKNGTPVNALLVTQIFTQLFLFSILSPQMNETYVTVITVGTTLMLIPYLLSSLYAVKVSLVKSKRIESVHAAIALSATLYSVYMIYTAGIIYLFSSLIFYALGAAVFYWAKRERKEPVPVWERWVMVVLALGAFGIVAAKMI